MITTLLEFAEEKINRHAASKTGAQAALSQAVQELADAQGEYDARVGEIADLDKQVRDKRNELAGALMPADIEAVADELRDLIVELRKNRAGLLDAEDEIGAARRSVAQAEEELKRAVVQLATSEEELGAALGRDGRHTGWKASVAAGDLSALADDAGALLDEVDDEADNGDPDPEDPLGDDKALIKAARDRTVNDLPEALLTRASERGVLIRDSDTARAALLVSTIDEAGSHLESNDGTAGRVAKRWVEFLRTEAAFKESVLLTASRYDQALALLKSITDSPALTDAETERINDATLVGEAEAAIVPEKARDDARFAVTTKEIEIDLAVARARAADIDADPEDDGDVQNLRTELEGLNTSLTGAEGGFTDDMRDNLDRLEASVPDHIWSNLTAYDRAVGLLAEIRDGDPGGLAAAMDAAESSLVEALVEADVDLRTRNYLDDLNSGLGGRVAFEASARQQRILSAVRGDK